MSSAIVLPTLTQWVENHLTAIIQAKTQTELESTLDAFFSKNATIIVNGTQISRADIFTQLYGQKIDEQSATVNFTASVAVPTTPGDNFTAGSVGVFYTVTIAESIRVLGGPVTKQVTTSLNAVVEQDPSIPQPPPSPIHGDFDGRRVTALNEVTLQVTLPPVLPTATTTAEGTSS